MLEGIVLNLQQVESSLNDAGELVEMALAENDDDSLHSIAADIEQTEKIVAEMEFRRRKTGARCCCACTSAMPNAKVFKSKF